MIMSKKIDIKSGNFNEFCSQVDTQCANYLMRGIGLEQLYE